ncbi:hypothetical protein ABPG74_001425 [Tetrahymena malaccensis]
MSTLGKVSQFDAVDDAVIVNIMVEERQRTLREKSKVFSSHILDIVVLGGINIIFASLFYFGYYVDSFHQETGENEGQCKELLKCSKQLAIFHTVCVFIYILLPVLCYLCANKEDPKYFSSFRTFNLAIQTITFLVLIVLTGHSLNSIAKKEPCGSLKIVFISYVILAICFVITILGILILNWIICDSPKANIESQDTQPINQIKEQIKYGSNQQI